MAVARVRREFAKANLTQHDDGWIYHPETDDVRIALSDDYPFTPPIIQRKVDGAWQPFFFEACKWAPSMTIEKVVHTVLAMHPTAEEDEFFSKGIRTLDVDEATYCFEMSKALQASREQASREQAAPAPAPRVTVPQGDDAA